jgi:uncharacterized protein (DUF302 family)
MEYRYKRVSPHPYKETVEKVTAELKKQGFGVLTSIDVKATLKEKLGVDFDNYIILGACNPPFANKALQVERDLGLFMPCNLIVYDEHGQTYIAATLPTVTMQVVGNPKLAEIAPQVEQKLKAAIDRV